MNPNLRGAPNALPRAVFKVWHKMRKRLYVLRTLQAEKIMIVVDVSTKIPNQVLMDDQDQKHCVLLQWTGMRDSAEQDLYEGDVVTIQDGHRAGQEAVVIWMSGSWLLWCDSADDRGQVVEVLFPLHKAVLRQGCRFELEAMVDRP